MSNQWSPIAVLMLAISVFISWIKDRKEYNDDDFDHKYLDESEQQRWIKENVNYE